MKELAYEITFTSIYRFLERFSNMTGACEQSFILSCYLCELCLIEVNMNKWLPSRVACSALYLAKKMLKKRTPWTKAIQNVT